MFKSPPITRRAAVTKRQAGASYGGNNGDDDSAKQLHDELRASLLFNKVSSGFHDQTCAFGPIRNGSWFLNDDHDDYDNALDELSLLQVDESGISDFRARPFVDWNARRKALIAGGANTPLKISLDEMSLGRLKGHQLLASSQRHRRHKYQDPEEDASVKKRSKKGKVEEETNVVDATQMPDYLSPRVFSARRMHEYDQQFEESVQHYNLSSTPPSGNLVLPEYSEYMRKRKRLTNDGQIRRRRNSEPNAKSVSPGFDGCDIGEDDAAELIESPSPRDTRWDSVSHVSESESEFSSRRFEARGCGYASTGSVPSVTDADLSSDVLLQDVDDMGQESIDYTIFGSLFKLEKIWKALVHATKKLVAQRLATSMVPRYTRSLLKAIERGIMAYRSSAGISRDEDNVDRNEMVEDTIGVIESLVSKALADMRKLIHKSKNASDSQSLGRNIDKASHLCRELSLVVFPKMVKLLDECLCRYHERQIKSEREIAQAVRISQCTIDIARKSNPRNFQGQHFLRSQISNYSLDVGYLLLPLMLAFQCERKRLENEEWLKQGSFSLSALDFDPKLFAPRKPWSDPEGYALVHGLRVHRGPDRYARILLDSPVLKDRNVSEMQRKAREVRDNYKRAREDEGRPLDPEKWRWLLNV